MKRNAPRRNLIEASASIYSRLDCTPQEALQRQIYGLINGPESGRKAWAQEIEYATYQLHVWTEGSWSDLTNESGEYVRDEKGARIELRNVVVRESDDPKAVRFFA